MLRWRRGGAGVLVRVRDAQPTQRLRQAQVAVHCGVIRWAAVLDESDRKGGEEVVAAGVKVTTHRVVGGVGVDA